LRRGIDGVQSVHFLLTIFHQESARMKKSVLAVLAALSLAACGGGEKKTEQPQAGSAPAANAEAAATDTLNIYNWSNYVDESTVEDFKKANKLKLTYDLYENNETLEAKMLTGKSGYDLVVPGIAFLPRQIEAGAYQKINKDLPTFILDGTFFIFGDFIINFSIKKDFLVFTNFCSRNCMNLSKYSSCLYSVSVLLVF